MRADIREKLKRFFWHGYWTDPVVFFSLVLAILSNIAIWLITWRVVEPTSEPIILHYNIYFGVDIVGDWRNVFFLTTIATGFLVVNMTLSRFFYYKERLASYLFAVMALLAQLLMAVGLGSIILINF